MDPTRSQIAFFRKFAHLYDSGISLTDALDLARGDVSGEMHVAVGQVVDDIYRGTSLADALGARSHLFSPEIVALIRAGELQGELSKAARNAADGLDGGVLEATAPDAAAGEALLLAAGDARIVHVSPQNVVRARTADGLEALEDPAPAGAVAALLERADETGSFLWEDRLIRITCVGEHATIQLSAVPAKEPTEATAWRAAGGGLLVLHGDRRADFDCAIRSILRGFDAEKTMRVVVGRTVPEAVAASDVQMALRLDPDVVVVWHPTPSDVDALNQSGVLAIIVARGIEGFDGDECALCPVL